MSWSSINEFMLKGSGKAHIAKQKLTEIKQKFEDVIKELVAFGYNEEQTKIQSKLKKKLAAKPATARQKMGLQK